MEVGSDQTTDRNKNKEVMIDSQHKCEVVETNMCAECLIDSRHKSEVMGSLVKRRGPKLPEETITSGDKTKTDGMEGRISQ